jgi:hypothetical protein
MIELEQLCCLIGNLTFVLVNRVVIGCIILMVIVRALVFLYSLWQSLGNECQHLAFSYAVWTFVQPEWQACRVQERQGGVGLLRVDKKPWYRRESS